jgi:hypothetical protein
MACLFAFLFNLAKASFLQDTIKRVEVVKNFLLYETFGTLVMTHPLFRSILTALLETRPPKHITGSMCILPMRNVFERV